ncbi:MAG: hypothetical protein NW241_10860 [Bacteroidia bacterium]|nr:hypothetical protein [Bacteroidia bacterium]
MPKPRVTLSVELQDVSEPDAQAILSMLRGALLTAAPLVFPAAGDLIEEWIGDLNQISTLQATYRSYDGSQFVLQRLVTLPGAGSVWEDVAPGAQPVIQAVQYRADGIQHRWRHKATGTISGAQPNPLWTTLLDQFNALELTQAEVSAALAGYGLFFDEASGGIGPDPAAYTWYTDQAELAGAVATLMQAGEGWTFGVRDGKFAVYSHKAFNAARVFSVYRPLGVEIQAGGSALSHQEITDALAGPGLVYAGTAYSSLDALTVAVLDARPDLHAYAGDGRFIEKSSSSAPVAVSIASAPAASDQISELLGAGFLDADVTGVMQKRYGTGVWGYPYVFPAEAETVGQVFRLPESQFRCVRMSDYTVSQHNGERTRFLRGAAADGSDSYFVVPTGSFRLTAFRLSDGAAVNDASVSGTESNWRDSCCPAFWTADKYLYTKGGKWHLIDILTDASTEWWDLTAGHAGYIVGDQGGFLAGGDGNEPVRIYDEAAGKFRTLLLITGISTAEAGGNPRKDNAWVADLENRVGVRQVWNAAQLRWELAEYAASDRALYSFDLPAYADSAQLAVSDDAARLHLLSWEQGSDGAPDPGTKVLGFHANTYAENLIGELSNYSSHTDTFIYTRGDGARLNGLIMKGTSGTPGTGTGDVYFTVYRLAVSGSGVRSLADVALIEVCDWASLNAPSGLAQVAASQYNDKYVTGNYKPDQSGEPAGAFRYKREIHLFPSDARLVYPPYTTLPMRICGEFAPDQDATGDQPEHWISHILGDGTMRIFFRRNAGTEASNRLYMVWIEPQPSADRLLPRLNP